MTTEEEREAAADYLFNKITGTIALQAEIVRLRTVNRDLMETMEQFSKCNLNDDNCASLEVASRRIRNTAQLAINKAEDSK